MREELARVSRTGIEHRWECQDKIGGAPRGCTGLAPMMEHSRAPEQASISVLSASQSFGMLDRAVKKSTFLPIHLTTP